jgi:hypothetical protein
MFGLREVKAFMHVTPAGDEAPSWNDATTH